MTKLRVKVHAIIQMEDQELNVEDIRTALANSEDIESRPHEEPNAARLMLGMCRIGALHLAVRDNFEEDEIIVETAYRPDPVLWEPDFKTRRKRR